MHPWFGVLLLAVKLFQTGHRWTWVMFIHGSGLRSGSVWSTGSSRA